MANNSEFGGLDSDEDEYLTYTTAQNNKSS